MSDIQMTAERVEGGAMSTWTITLEQHRKILYEIRVRVGAVALYQEHEYEQIADDLDALVKWIDEMRDAS